MFGAIAGPGKYIPSNTHFDTTRANIENTGCLAVDLVTSEASDPENTHPFKGNMDIKALDEFIQRVGAANIPVVMITITNNTGGGQPVSMKNMKVYNNIVCQEKNGFATSIQSLLYALYRR